MPLARSLALASLLSWALPALAANFGISPLRAVLSAANPTAALTLRNEGAEPVVVQLQVVAWSQEGGVDVYVPTTDIIATPPIFTVKNAGAQVVRVGLRRPPDAQRELTYRLYLQEVTGAPKAGGPGLQMALRIGVPVFVAPQVPERREMQWQGERTDEGRLRIRALNSGNVHIQVIDFKLVQPGSDRVIAANPAAAYLLPGQAREWLLKPDAPLPTGGLQLQAHTDGGKLSADIALSTK